MLVVKRYPELFHAYVGIGQEACSPEREHEIQDAWIREQAALRGDEEAQRRLQSEQSLDCEELLFKYGAEIRGETDWHGLLKAGLSAPEYSLADVLRVKKGVAFSARNLKFNAIQGALMGKVQSVDVPVYFFTGRFDYTDPVPCTLEYFDRLRAPAKQIVWFDHSAHFLFLEEPDKFAEEMKRVSQRTGTEPQ